MDFAILRYCQVVTVKVNESEEDVLFPFTLISGHTSPHSRHQRPYRETSDSVWLSNGDGRLGIDCLWVRGQTEIVAHGMVI